MIGLLLILLQPGALAQNSRRHFQYIAPGDGKEIFEIYSAPFQDRFGLVWLAGAGAAGYFDGYAFHAITPTPDNSSGLPSGLVTGYFEDGKGALWAEAPTFLARFDRSSGRFETVFQFEKEKKRGVFFHTIFLVADTGEGAGCRAVIPDLSSGRLLPAEIRFPDGRLLDRLPDWCAADRDGRHYLAMEGLIYTAQTKPDARGLTLQSTGRNYHVGLGKVKNVLLYDSAGTAWAITNDDRLVVMPRQAHAFIPFDRIAGLRIDSRGEIQPSVMEDRRHRIWITTPEKIYIYNPADGACDSLLPRRCADDGLIGSGIYTVFQHQDDTYWVGSVYGATVITEMHSPFTHWNNPSDTVTEMVYAVLEATDGTVWAGARNSGLYHLDRHLNILEFYPIRTPGSGSRTGGGVTSLLEDAQGFIWVGTYDLGLFRLDPQRRRMQAIPISPDDPGGLPTGKIFRTAITDRQGNLWFARCNGISVWHSQAGRFNNISLPGLSPADPCHHLYALAEDIQGNIWIGEGAPVFYRYEPATGLFETHRLPFPREFVQAIHVDSGSGNLWLGTLEHGLAHYSPRERRMLAYYDKQGNERLGEVTAIIPDAKGALWLATAGGIARFDTRTKTYEHFGLNEGLACDYFMSDAWYRSPRSGKIYFGCNDGLIVFQPDSVKQTTRAYDAPLVFLSARVAGLEKYLPPNAVELELQAGERNLELRFTSLDYRYPGQKKYAFYLEGLEKPWGDTSGTPWAIYRNLAPGRYTFHLKGTDSHGQWMEKERALRIIVQPFWWQSAWFKTVAGLAIACMLAGILWLMIHRQRRQLLERQAALEKASHEALLAALRNQMEPHFIFNSLNAANEYLSENDVAGANRFLSRFAALMDMQMGDLRRHFVPLSQEIQFLELYLEIQHRRYRDKFDYRIEVDVPPTFDPILPSMLVQPFVENAIRHGLRALDHKGFLLVRFTKQSGALICMVEDNGVGRKKAEMAQDYKNVHHYIGLENVKKRIALLNQLYDADLFFYIEDLVNSAGAPAGTRVILKMKIRES